MPYANLRIIGRPATRAARAAALAGLFLLALTNAVAHPAWGLVIDRQGQIFFSDVDNNTIWKVAADGRPTPFVTGKHSHELFIDEAGNLYGEHVYYDAANNLWINSLWKASPDGQVTEILGPTANVPKGLGSLIDAEGNTYAVSGVNDGVQEYVLARRRPDGSIETLAGSVSGHADGKGAEAKFAAVQAKVIGPDGAIYLTDAACVRRVGLDGTVTTLGGNPLAGVERGEHPRLLGLAVDGVRNIYVADYDWHCLRRLATDGNVTTVLESGAFWSPTGIALVGDKIYVHEHRPERRQRIHAVVYGAERADPRDRAGRRGTHLGNAGKLGSGGRGERRDAGARFRVRAAGQTRPALPPSIALPAIVGPSGPDPRKNSLGCLKTSNKIIPNELFRFAPKPSELGRFRRFSTPKGSTGYWRKYTFPACRISQYDNLNVNNAFFGFTRLCVFAKLQTTPSGSTALGALRVSRP